MSKTFKPILGAIFIFLGLFGFISNPLIGANAIFVTNAATNWVHLIAGVALLVAARYAR